LEENAAIGRRGLLAAIHGDVVTSGGQSRRELFGESFETAIAGWDAAGA